MMNSRMMNAEFLHEQEKLMKEVLKEKNLFRKLFKAIKLKALLEAC